MYAVIKQLLFIFCHVSITHCSPRGGVTWATGPYRTWTDDLRRAKAALLPTELRAHMATTAGFAPATSSVTDWYSSLLNYVALWVAIKARPRMTGI